jgi:hypothetical protein
MRLRGLCCLAGGFMVLSGTGALADDSGAPVATAPTSTDQKIAQWLKDAPPTEGESDERPVRGRGCQAAAPDRKMHGEVGAAIGSGGYRSAYGVVNMPMGDSSSATVAVATEQGRGWGRGRWGGGGASFAFSGAWRSGHAGPTHPHHAAANCSQEADAAAAPPAGAPEPVPDASGGIPPQH